MTEQNEIFLNHLGANLTTTDAVNTFGKTGDESTDFVTTTEGGDDVHIGYRKDEAGNIVSSIWDGDFEKDAEDADGVWTLDTAGGDDNVVIRDEQRQFTVTKLGEGDDTYTLGHSLEAAYGLAQEDDSARGYVFAEEGNDTITINGQIDGGRIFAGAGSDTITVNGEMDDGGVIDLGAGKTEYADGHAEAASVDSADDVNTLFINGDLGESDTNDFGKVFGGAGKDIVVVDDEIQGESIIELKDNNDEVTVAFMQDNAKILTANDDDKVTVNGSMFNNSIINTAGLVSEGETIIDRVLVTVLPDGTEVYRDVVTQLPGRTDDDIVDVAVSMINDSHIDVGPGFNQITIGEDVDDRSSIVAGDDKDILHVKDDLEDSASVNLGHGENEITIDSTIEDNATLVTGDGNDILNVGYAIANNSVVNLGAGNNVITVGDDLDGNAKLITGAGDDKVFVGDDVENTFELALGEGNNLVDIADQFGGLATLTTGAGDDVLNIGYALATRAAVDLGNGVNTITVGDDVDGESTLTTGDGNDTLTVGDDVEDTSIINLGNGDNVINILDQVEDASQIITGAGNDVVTVGDAIVNAATISLGAGDDAISVANGIYNYAKVDGGEGNDTLTIGADNGVRAYAWTNDFTNIETVDLAGKTKLSVFLSDLVEDASLNGLFITGTEDTTVRMMGGLKETDETFTNDAGQAFDVYSSVVDGTNYSVYVDQDVTVI